MIRSILTFAILAVGAVLVAWQGSAPAEEGGAASRPASPVVVLKLDDVVPSGEEGGPVSPRWKRVAEYLEKNEIKGSMGIICSSLEANNPVYFDWIKEHQKKGIIEFWLHGYYNRKASDKFGEFDKGTFEEQKAVIDKSAALAREKLGFAFVAFGPHWSGTTEETEKALQANEDVKVWLCGPKASKYYKKLSLPWVIALENPIFEPNFEKFKAAYEKMPAGQQVLALQGHSDQWNPQRWAEFVKIVEFLKAKGCKFMTPSEYLKSVSPEAASQPASAG